VDWHLTKNSSSKVQYISDFTSGKKIKQIFLPIVMASVVATGCSSTSSDSDDTDSTDASDTSDSSSSSLVINEIVAKDVSGGHDWFELYVSEGSVNLSDYSIVDNDESHEAQSLPDITLSAGEFLVIEAIDEDDTASDDTAYVTFKLGSSDSLTLTTEGSIVSTLTWEEGDADEGYSYGLLTDGTGSATTLNPTKGYSNEAADDPVDETVVFDTIVDSFPALVVNEIVAKGLSDSAEGYDWIELYAAGNESISLSDYSLRDSGSTEAFSLPNITLAPGEFYTVYATDETLESVETVAFKLGSSDSVSVFNGDDLIDTIEWDKGDALYGFSYGRYQDGSGAQQTLTPTLNAANEIGTRGPLVINEIVSKDAAEGNDWFEVFNNSAESIELGGYSVIDESDGLEPVSLPDVTLASGEYLTIYATDEDPGTHYVPFKLGSSDSLSLMLNDETLDYLEWDESDAPQGFSYGAYPDGSWTLRTLTPTSESSNSEALTFDTSSIESFFVDISDDAWSDMMINALDEENHTASITYKGVTLEEIAIRTKGNSSLSSVASTDSERFSFKVDMNEYVDGQKLLNLKKLNLNNSYKDPSYMRERIAYNIMREAGLPAPQNAYVNLYINGELHGLYSMVEQVDSEFLEQHFSDSEGDLYKPDAIGSTDVGNTLEWVDGLYDSYLAIELKTNEETTDNQALIAFLDELNNGSDYDSVMDVDAMLRYTAASTVMSNLDSYQGQFAHNYYLYENSNQFSVIPWDLNESFGTFAMGCTTEEMLALYIDEPTSGALAERSLIDKLLQDSDNVDAYHGYIEEIITGGLDPTTLEQTINDTADLIRTAVAADPTSFYTAAEFEASLTEEVGGVPGLLSFVSARVENILDQLDGTLPSSGDGSGSCSGGDVGGIPGEGLPPGPPPV